MISSSASGWLDRVRTTAAGPELLELLERRLAQPYEEGPTLNDRHGEGPEEVFERLATDDEVFRARLDETIAAYFRSPAAPPTDEPARLVIRGLLEIVQRLALTGVFAPLRAWLQQHALSLEEGVAEPLGRAALAALATAQPQGLAEVRDFWLRWWRTGPPAWQPRAFIGLRLQDPATAALQIPELLQRAKKLQEDPNPLLFGMWNQSSARNALVTWLRQNEHLPEADEVRRSLRRCIPQADWGELGKPKPRRCLPSLASCGDRKWAS